MRGLFLVFVCFATCVQVTSCGGKTSSQLRSTSDSELLYVRVPSAMLSYDWVQKTDFNRDHGKDPIYALGWMTKRQLDSLSHEDKASITVLDEQSVSRGYLNPFTLEKNISLVEETPKEDYHNYIALTKELQNLSNTYSSLAQLESLGKSDEGRDLWMIRLSANIASQDKKPKLLYIANMHGDEVVGRELTIYHIRRLLTGYGNEPRVTTLLDNAQVFIVPSMNPDGFERGRRYNVNNVDLNRDFPDFTSDNSDTVAGRADETAAIMSLHANHHFVSSINFHGGEVCFNLPWDTQRNNSTTKFGDDQILSQMGRAYADSNPTMESNDGFDRGLTYGFEWYEVDGGLQDWSIYYRQSMHATVELSYTKYPPASQLPKAWDENKESMLAFMERSLNGVHVEAVNENGEPVRDITVSVGSSKRSIKFVTSYATRTTTDGPQTVKVEAPGYVPATLSTNARFFDGRHDVVVLRKI